MPALGTSSTLRKFLMLLMRVSIPGLGTVNYSNFETDIQGVDQLVEKFRNSSVMDQDPAYRPKVRRFCSQTPLQEHDLILYTAVPYIRSPCW